MPLSPGLGGATHLGGHTVVECCSSRANRRRVGEGRRVGIVVEGRADLWVSVHRPALPWDIRVPMVGHLFSG